MSDLTDCIMQRANLLLNLLLECQQKLLDRSPVVTRSNKSCRYVIVYIVTSLSPSALLTNEMLAFDLRKLSLEHSIIGAFHHWSIPSLEHSIIGACKVIYVSLQ